MIDLTQKKERIIALLNAVREQKPLVVNITNYVVMNNTANALLAMGASPLMAHSQQEMAEMMRFSGALVINIGTLDSVWIPRMEYAVEQANANGKTIVLDPVGCGASDLRTKTARKIVQLADKLIVRGNASEIMALAGEQAQRKGVDALDASESALNCAKFLANNASCSVVISGATDYVVTETDVSQLRNGDEMMPYVTGMGCTHTALIGAFAALGDDSGLAATAVLGVAGEMAAEKSAGPGSLQVNLLDTLYQLDGATLLARLKLA
ncbi:MAG: hydroxyethylthiazole kinase [Pontiella sp.]